MASLRPQVDRLCVFHSGGELPAWRDAFSGVEWAHSEALCGTEKKFAFLAAASNGDRYFACDDDFVYPDDYISVLEKALLRHPCDIVGVHGHRFPLRAKRYIESLDGSAHWRLPLFADRLVHVLGTGTLAFHVDARFATLSFAKPNAADISLAVWAKAQGIGLWAIKRRSEFLRWTPQPAGTSIYESHLRDDSYETALMHAASPWPSFA